jgi:hypothetical protein
VTEETPRYLYSEVIPRTDVDTPSLNWVGQRFMRAFTRYQELERRISEIATSIREYPRVRVSMADANRPNPPLQIDQLSYAERQAMLDLGLLASEVLHHMRCAVDYLVYNLAWLDSGQRQEHTQFPVCSKAADFNSAGTQKRMKGLTDEHKSWIEAVQPFNGESWAQLLASLSNIDKHRFVLETSPTLRFRIDLHSGRQDPTDPSFAILPTDTWELTVRVLSDDGSTRNVLEIFAEIFAGASTLVNRFFEEAGVSPIEFGRR